MLIVQSHYTFHSSKTNSDESILMISFLSVHVLGNLGSNSVHVGGSFLGKSFTNDEVFTIIILIGDLSDEGSSL